MPEKRKTHLSWKSFLAGASLPIILGLSQCNPRPEWNAKFWAGDSQYGSIRRAQDHEIIECMDPRFDDYVCMTYDDIMKLEKEVLNRCESWRP